LPDAQEIGLILLGVWFAVLIGSLRGHHLPTFRALDVCGLMKH
jgi:hypothetical protein